VGSEAEIATFMSRLSTALQAAITAADCAQGVDGSCLANSFATVLGGLGTRLGSLSGRLWEIEEFKDLAIPAATFGFAASLSGAIFGAPGIGGRLDRTNENC